MVMDYSTRTGVTSAELDAEKLRLQRELDALRIDFLKQRFLTYTQRQNFLTRIREAEAKYNGILSEILRSTKRIPYDLYASTQPIRQSGIDVTVEFSLDGVIFSNPAPTIANNVRVWVRAKIDEAHRGNVGVPKTHELVHLKWVYSTAIYRKFDNIPVSGHDEYFVSFPLVITREFQTATTGSTKHNFLVYADIYEKIG